MAHQTTAEVTVSRDDDTAQGYVELDADAERDLLAGTASAADGLDGDVDGLEELQEQLMGYQLNSEREEAWVRRIVLPGNRVDGLRARDGEVGIEFLLPSGDTISRTYDLPDKRWTEHNEFAELLDQTGVEPSTLETLVGESVDLAYRDGAWRLVGLEVSDETDEQTEHQPEEIEPEELLFPVVMLGAMAVAGTTMLGLQSLGMDPTTSGYIGLGVILVLTATVVEKFEE